MFRVQELPDTKTPKREGAVKFLHVVDEGLVRRAALPAPHKIFRGPRSRLFGPSPDSPLRAGDACEKVWRRLPRGPLEAQTLKVGNCIRARAKVNLLAEIEQRHLIKDLHSPISDNFTKMT